MNLLNIDTIQVQQNQFFCLVVKCTFSVFIILFSGKFLFSKGYLKSKGSEAIVQFFTVDKWHFQSVCHFKGKSAKYIFRQTEND